MAHSGQSPAPRKVTIADIARTAGISVTTVSHALSGKRPVSTAARERIDRAISDLGYRPSHRARALAMGRSQTVVLDVPIAIGLTHELPFGHLQMAIAASQALSERDYHLILVVSDQLDAARLTAMAGAHVADGFILPDVHLHDPRVEELQAAGRPFVTVGRILRHRSVSWVDSDDEGAGRAVALECFRLGRRRVLVLLRAGEQRRFGHAYWFLRGVRQAYRERRIDWSEAIVRYVQTDSVETGDLAASEGLAESRDVGAIVTGNDALAVGALRAVKALGMRVPEDVAVFGLGNSTLGRFSEPPISTLAYRYDDMGRIAVELLLEQIDHQDVAPKHVLLPFELVLRGSTEATRLPPAAGSHA